VNVLSLFTGIGGLDLGLQRAGMTIAGQVEIDPWCRKVLAKHWPEVPRHDDVRTAAGWWGGRAADLVCGGFPCQPVSLAGKREGQADSRWLWPAFAATVRALRPRYIVVENTPGLTSLGMGDVVGDLAALGYDAEWDCLPACWFGAPHIRERVFLVAYPGLQAGRRIRAGRRQQQPQGGEAPRALADADRGGLKEQPERHGEPQSRIFTSSWHDTQRRDPHAADPDSEPLGRPAESRRERGHWAAEPDVGRVAHGIPARVDRLLGLGNAVVPQVAEHIGRLIMTAAAA